jgi:hypothetical protein
MRASNICRYSLEFALIWPLGIGLDVLLEKTWKTDNWAAEAAVDCVVISSIMFLFAMLWGRCCDKRYIDCCSIENPPRIEPPDPEKGKPCTQLCSQESFFLVFGTFSFGLIVEYILEATVNHDSINNAWWSVLIATAARSAGRATGYYLLKSACSLYRGCQERREGDDEEKILPIEGVTA